MLLSNFNLKLLSKYNNFSTVNMFLLYLQLFLNLFSDIVSSTPWIETCSYSIPISTICTCFDLPAIFNFPAHLGLGMCMTPLGFHKSANFKQYYSININIILCNHFYYNHIRES